MTKININIPFGYKPNVNNMIYPPEVVKKMAEQISQSKIPITSSADDISSAAVNLKDVVGQVEEAVYDEDMNHLTLTCEISEEVANSINNGLKIVPNHKLDK